MIKTIRTFAERVMDAYMQMDWEQVYRLEHTDEFGREFPQIHVEPPKQTAELNKPYMSERVYAEGEQINPTVDLEEDEMWGWDK